MKKIVTTSIIVMLFSLLMTPVFGCQEKPSPQPTPTPAPEPTVSAEPEPPSSPEPSPTPAPISTPTPAPPVTEELSFSIELPPVEVAAGETHQLEVIATDERGEHLSDFDTAWIVSDKNAGSITETGVLTAGEVTGSFADAVEVKVTKGDLIRTAVATITILPSSLEHIGIAPNPAEIGMEMTQQFVAVGADRYGNRISNLDFTWSVENDGGTIDGTGFFTAGATSCNYTDTVKVEATQGSVTRSATANVTVEPDRIVFMSVQENDQRDIYIIDDDGSNLNNLVSSNEKEFKFSCSPDGHRIVYDAGDTYGKIMVMNTDGSGKLCLLENGSDIKHIFPAWSPDGARLVFSSYSDKEEDWDIFVVDADGGNLTQLTNTSNCSESAPRWSPNGARIAFSSYNDKEEDWDIYLMDADGGNLTQLTDTTDCYEFAHGWSPDGTQIVFSSCNYKDENSDIYVIDANGGNLTQLTDRIYNEVSPKWSPDGTKIIYSVGGEIWVINADGTRIMYSAGGETWVMNADGSEQKRLFQAKSPKWSPDSTQIAFTSEDGIYVMNADGTSLRQLKTNKELMTSSRPAWSPDGSKIVFVSSEYEYAIEHSHFDPDTGMVTTWGKQHKRDEIYVMNSDGSHKVRLTNNSDRVISSTRWVPRKRGVEVTEDSVIMPKPAP